MIITINKQTNKKNLPIMQAANLKVRLVTPLLGDKTVNSDVFGFETGDL